MSCREDNCYDNECGYIDIIHFQHRCRHYENGNVTLTWSHQPPVNTPSFDFPPEFEFGRRTNFYEFTGHGEQVLWDEAGQNYWERRCWVLGQHPIGWIDEILEELNITLTPEEDRLLNDCDLLLYYGTELVWKHNIVPGQNPLPGIGCVLTDAGKGTLVKTIWSTSMYQTGYQWRRAADFDCDIDGFAFQDRSCVWRNPNEGHNQIGDYPNYGGAIRPSGRQYLLHTSKPTRKRVVFFGPPAGKVADGDLDSEAVTFGHICQIRDVLTGELLFDGSVESEIGTPHFTFEGSEVTCSPSDPFCEPTEVEPTIVGEKIGYVPTGLHWAYAFDDTALLACMSVYGNRADYEALEDENGNFTSLLPVYGTVRLVTLHQSDDNEHVLQESNRSPLSFVPLTLPPTFSPDGDLWVSGYNYSYDLPRDDPDWFIEYGVFQVGMGNVGNPLKVERYDNMVGSLDVWCDELYALPNGSQKYVHDTTSIEPFTPARSSIYPGDEIDGLSVHLNTNVGYWGWEWGFWDEGYTDFQGQFWNFSGWGFTGWSYGGNWGCGIASFCTNYFYGPVTWTNYVVADWTPGGDLDKISTTYNPTQQQLETTNPCRDICHDGDLEDDGDGCNGCNCGDVELEVVFDEEPDCTGRLGITVTCAGCGSRNQPSQDRHTFQWAVEGLSYDLDCLCNQAGLTFWNEGICGAKFFIQLGAHSAIQFIYGRCGCGWQCCYPLPDWECPITIEGPFVFIDGDTDYPGHPGDECWTLDPYGCYADACHTTVQGVRWYGYKVTIDCPDPPTPEGDIEWSHSGTGSADWCGDGSEVTIYQESEKVFWFYKCGGWAAGNSVPCGGDPQTGTVYQTITVRIPDTNCVEISSHEYYNAA